MSELLSTVRLEECEGIHASEDNVRVFVDDKELAKGKLVISESFMCWQRSDGKGMCLPYPAISLHAVSRDLNAFPHECLYLMIDANKLPNAESGEPSHSGTDEDEEEILEIRFVPESGATLSKLFDATSQCQLLHPDPEDDDLSDDYVDADEDEEGEEEQPGVGGGGDGTVGMEHFDMAETTTNGHHAGITGDATPAGGVVPDSEAGQFDDAEDMETQDA